MTTRPIRRHEPRDAEPWAIPYTDGPRLRPTVPKGLNGLAGAVDDLPPFASYFPISDETEMAALMGMGEEIEI